MASASATAGAVYGTGLVVDLNATNATTPDWADLLAPLPVEQDEAIRQWFERLDRPTQQSPDEIEDQIQQMFSSIDGEEYLLPPLQDQTGQDVAEEPSQRKDQQAAQCSTHSRNQADGTSRQADDYDGDNDDDDDDNGGDDREEYDEGGDGTATPQDFHELAYTTAPPPTPSSLDSSEIRWYSRCGRFKGATKGLSASTPGHYGVSGEYAVVRISQKGRDGQLKQTRMFLRRSRKVTEAVLSRSASIFTRLSKLRREIHALSAVDPETVSSSVTHLDGLIKLWGAQRSAARINLRMMKIV